MTTNCPNCGSPIFYDRDSNGDFWSCKYCGSSGNVNHANKESAAYIEIYANDKLVKKYVKKVDENK